MENPVVAIINPVSGAQNKQQVKQTIEAEFLKCGLEVNFFETSTSLSATDIAREKIKEGATLILSVGGDGTIREIIDAIAYTNVTLGIIPNGTGNLLATALGIPIDTAKSVDIICKGHTRVIDLGKLNNHHFAIIAGCGFDAEIMKNVTREHKKFFGLFAYYFEGFKQAFSSKRTSFYLSIDGKKVKHKALNLLVVNSGCILGNFFNIVPGHSLSDDILDVLVVSPRNLFDFIPVVCKLITQKDHKHSNDPRIIKYSAKSIEIKTKTKVVIQADGDIYGYTPVRITSAPKALKVCVPERVDTFLMNPDNFFKSILKGLISDFEKYQQIISRLDEFK